LSFAIKAPEDEILNFEAIVFQNLNNTFELKKIIKVEPPPRCPVCYALAIRANSTPCFGGPQDACSCCLRTSEVIKTEAERNSTQWQLCSLPPLRHCQRFDNEKDCQEKEEHCRKVGIKPWLCGSCRRLA